MAAREEVSKRHELAAQQKKQGLLASLYQAAALGFTELAMNAFDDLKRLVRGNEAMHQEVLNHFSDDGFDYLADQWRREKIGWQPRDMDAIADSLERFKTQECNVY